MAWLEGLSSLKGQISNLAKGVLTDETDSERPSSVDLAQSSSATKQEAGGWDESFQTDAFLGQDNEAQPSKDPKNEEEESMLSKGLASLLSIGKGTDVEAQLQSLQEENRALREENESKTREIRTCSRIIEELESMVAVSQDENSNLSTGMEELDIQHQQAIEQVLSVKEDTQKQFERLQVRHAELESKYKELACGRPKIEKKTVAVETDSHAVDLMSELEDRDREVDVLESEVSRLSQYVAELEQELENRKESLAPIPENSEELELRVNSLEGEIMVLREVRTNLETEVQSARELNSVLNQRLEVSNSILRNQENLQIDHDKLTNLCAQKDQELAQCRNIHEKETADLKAKVKELEMELGSKTEYIANLEEGSEASSHFLKDENAKLSLKVAHMVQQAQTLDKDLEKAQSENEMKDKKLCEFVFEVNSVREELKASERAGAENLMKIKELQDRIDQLEPTESQYKEKIKILERELQLVKDNEIVLNDEIQALTEAKSELERQLGTTHSETELMAKNELIKGLESKLKEKEEKFLEEKNNLMKELEATRNSLSEFQINKDLTRETVIELKKQLEEKDDEFFKQTESCVLKMSHMETLLKEKETEVVSLRGKISEVELSLEASQNALKTAESNTETAETLKTELAHYQSENKRLLNEIELLKATEHQVEALIERTREYGSQLDKETQKSEALLAENDELRRSLQMKHTESSGYNKEVQRLNSVLNVELSKNEKLAAENSQLSNSISQLHAQMQEKMMYLEQMESEKNKQISALSQEVETLKNQLEYVSQLLKSVERGEGEGQGDAPPQQKNCCSETQEELNQVTAALLKEQTENKLLKNKIEDLNERVVRDNAQLSRLKEHLVTIEENYTAELMSAQSRISELSGKLAQADDRARTSSTAYTSANIRANQQVESLTQQVKLLTEHKEKLEAQLSTAEDEYLKQSTVVTNLQAVLHQFQKEKQNEIEFETERIRQKLSGANARNEELQLEIKTLQDQLNETKKGLAAANRLTEQLDHKTEEITVLHSQVAELQNKLKAEEEKLKAVYTNVEGKVDRNLVKNLVVGYVCSPANAKTQVLRVVAQVLDLNKEERAKVGLEAGNTAQHQSFSEAFIKFLESESQPKPQVFLPLTQPNSTPPSRKTSSSGPASLLLSEEIPSTLPHFSVGRSTSSILKDVMKDRNS